VSGQRLSVQVECTLWWCEKCEQSAVLLWEAHTDFYSVLDQLRAAHAASSPNCDRVEVYVTRPAGWWKSVMRGEEPSVPKEPAAAESAP